MRQVFYTLLMLLALLPAVQGQQVPTIVPPSPEAASTFKFTEVPVSLYTGVPNINIPIYTIEARGLTIPISISYHARGIKVDEIASRVGLGWTLNCGGMVSRQVRGLRDDGPGGYLYTDSNSDDFFNNTLKRQNLSAAHNTMERDFIPDQYFFDANGISGKFILDRLDGGKPLMQHYSDTKIEALVGGGWVIIDNKGNRYTFTKAESEQVAQSFVYMDPPGDLATIQGQDGIPSTWLLAGIVTALGESIEFVYEQEETIFHRKSHDAIQMIPGAGSDTAPVLGTEYESHFSRINGHGWRVKRINYDKGWVTFTYQAREDLSGSGRLKTVSVFNTQGTKIKEYNLEYEYTEVTVYDANVNYYLNNYDPQAKKRLFLKSIEEVATSGTQTKPSHRFEYNTTQLPNRHSSAQDFWGYYNGRNNGRFLKTITPEIGDRSVDEDKSEAGILKKILYPEGGSTTFTYEHNKVRNFAFAPEMLPNDLNPMRLDTVNMGFLDRKWDANNNGAYSRSFSVPANKIGPITVDIDLFNNDFGCGTSPTNHSNACRFIITITKPGMTTMTLFKGVHQISLDPGEYKLNVKAMPISGPFLFNDPNIAFHVGLKWLTQLAKTSELVYASGKRIKKIEYHDANGNPGLSKTYSYIIPSTGLSSGQLLGMPNFYGRKRTMTDNFGFPVSIFERHSCMPGSPLSTYQGNSLGYSMVTEYYGEGANTIGKTEHKFTMTPDGGTYYDFPYHAPADNEWIRGKEILTTHYRKDGNGYKKVREIDTRYLYGDEEIPNPEGTGMDPLDISSSPSTFTPFIPIPQASYIRPLTQHFSEPLIYYKKNSKRYQMPLTMPCQYTSTVNLSEPGYKTYHLYGGSMDLLSTISTDFFEDGSKFMTRTNYKYNYNKHYNVSESREDLDNGTLKLTRYFYPSDSLMAGKPNVAKLIAKNILSAPLVTQTYENGQKLSEQETQYRDWDTSAQRDLLAPEIIRTSKGNADLETRVRYNAVDPENGNPLEVQQENGSKITYLWGYNRTLPIAKIENASSQEVKTALGVTDIAAVNESNLAAINGLRSSLPQAMITTYTYKPEVGVTTMTDPKGDVLTYEYDGFNRLKLVRDKDNNILSENHYHYRPQN